jgi:hypothetical protein
VRAFLPRRAKNARNGRASAGAAAGHRRGYVQIRWQRLTRELGPGGGPRADVVKFADLASALPYYEQARVRPAQYAERIAARQAAVAARMLG